MSGVAIVDKVWNGGIAQQPTSPRQYSARGGRKRCAGEGIRFILIKIQIKKPSSVDQPKLNKTEMLKGGRYPLFSFQIIESETNI